MVVGYYVVAPDGQRYGPADVPTLNAWIQEGRLIGTTHLIDAASGQTVLAQHVPGLIFSAMPQTPMAPTGGFGAYTTPYDPQQSVSTSPYQGFGGTPLSRRPTTGSINITASYILSGISMVMCCSPTLSCLLAVAAIIVAGLDKTNHPQRSWAIGLGVTCLVTGLALAFGMQYLGSFMGR